MHRRGVTLLELLVAAGVFITGFVFVYTLFLVGSRYLRQSENMTRTALAASSIIAQIRVEAGLEYNAGLLPPSSYIGDGDAADGGAELDTDPYFFPATGQPGVWYRVTECTDLMGNDSTEAHTLVLTVVVFALPSPETSLSWPEARRGLGLEATNAQDGVLEMTDRGVANTYRAVITRTAPWHVQE